jgi:arylsulfatase A
MKKHDPRWRLIALPFLVLLLAAKVVKVPKDAPGPMEDYGARAEIWIKDVPYLPGRESKDDFLLDVYSNPHQGLWPVAIVIHGGSWINGTKENHNKVYVSKVMAANGYVVFNINYRLLPEARLKKQAEDCMAAVIWVKEHAREYGGDPDRIGVIGGSSGGHLAALVAWASDDPWFEPTGDRGPLDSDVKAAALYYPVIDLARTFRENGSWLGASLLPAIVVGRFETYDQALGHLSPVFHLDGQAVPTIFLCGDRDNLKLYPQAVEFSQKLRDLGVDSELYTAPGKDHAFTGQYWEPESLESVMRIVRFFDQHL